MLDSCHPPTCQQSIPFSLGMRINRICSKLESREQRLEELKELLIIRGYKSGMVNTDIARARAIPREKASVYVVKSSVTKIPVFVVSWDPRLPSIDAIQRKHWRAMINLDPYLKEAFPEPPLVAYKRQKNIRD